VLQKHCTKPVCHQLACRRVVQQYVVRSEFLGYARVSTAEQTAALQEDALRAAGCRRIWSDTASGTRTGGHVGGVAVGPAGSVVAAFDRDHR